MSATLRAACKSPRVMRLLLWLAASLPVWVGCVYALAGARPAKITDRTPPPSLVFEQYLVQPFLFEPQAVVPATFHFYNAGPTPVEITRIERSCGCLSQRLAKRVYEPGESGAIVLEVQTANEQPGVKDVYATVHYTDPLPRSVKLEFRVDIPEQQVKIRPKALIFYQLGEGQSTQEVEITDSRADRLRILDVETTSELVTARVVRQVEDDESKRVALEVQVPGSVPSGKHPAQILVRTDDRRFPTLMVPVLISGPASQTAATESEAH